LQGGANVVRVRHQIAPVQCEHAHLADVEFDPGERYARQQRGKGVLALADLDDEQPVRRQMLRRFGQERSAS